METSTAPTLIPCEPRTGGPAWRAAEAEGHDMSLIVESLRTEVWERFQTNDSALTLALMMRSASKTQHGGPGENPRATHRA